MKTFPSGDLPILCKKNNETVTLTSNITLLSRLLSGNRERGVYVQNILSRELCTVPLDLFFPNGAMRHTAKSNILNDIEIK